MSVTDQRDIAARKNRLLASFPAQALERVLAEGELCTLGMKQELHVPDGSIESVYFPLNCVVSLLASADGDQVEVATVGPEGIVGVPVFLGSGSASTLARVQIPGQAIRLDAGALRTMAREDSGVASVLGRYTQALLALISQSVACNRLHEVEARCARWLLITRDRVGEATFPVTQQFLAEMLGVRRASVTVAAGLLQRAGLIGYTRGKVTILDPQGLEEAACACYRLVADRYQRLLPLPAAAGAEGG